MKSIKRIFFAEEQAKLEAILPKNDDTKTIVKFALLPVKFSRGIFKNNELVGSEEISIWFESYTVTRTYKQYKEPKKGKFARKLSEENRRGFWTEPTFVWENTRIL